MTQKKSATTPKSATKKASAKGFSAEERAAMKERAAELRAEERGERRKEKGESDVRAALAELPKADRDIGERLHELITASAPDLEPKTWYGMPAYAKEGDIVCFFQPASKFESRYATLGFNDSANLDDGAMWPTAFALTKLTATQEKMIGALVKKAVH